MQVRITRNLSLPLTSVLAYLAPITIVIVLCAVLLPSHERVVRVLFPVAITVNAFWWGYVWHHKVRPE
jgi:hypothetical protein